MAVESEPALGSVIAMAPQVGLSPLKRARKRSFCSGVPAAATAAPPRPGSGIERYRPTSPHHGMPNVLAGPAGWAYAAPMLDWSECPAVERLPGKVSGAWLFKGTRVPVKALFENLEHGARVDDFLEWFPGVSRAQVEAVLEHAERSLAVA